MTLSLRSGNRRKAMKKRKFYWKSEASEGKYMTDRKMGEGRKDDSATKTSRKKENILLQKEEDRRKSEEEGREG